MLLSAFLAPRLSFDGRFVAVSAEAAGFGVGEFLLTIGSLYFSSGLGRQWDSFLFGILRYDYSLWSLLFGIICFCLLGNASAFFGRYSWVCSWSTFSWKREGMLEYNSFRILCGAAQRELVLRATRQGRPPSVRGGLPGRLHPGPPAGQTPVRAGLPRRWPGPSGRHPADPRPRGAAPYPSVYGPAEEGRPPSSRGGWQYMDSCSLSRRRIPVLAGRPRRPGRRRPQREADPDHPGGCPAFPAQDPCAAGNGCRRPPSARVLCYGSGKLPI